MSSQAQSSTGFAASGASAIRNILITVGVLAGIYVAYGRYQNNSRTLRGLNTSAKDLLDHDLPRDYLEASRKLHEALQVRSSDRYAIAALAEVEALLWVDHGLVSNSAEARQHAALAASEEINSAERFSAEAMVAIGEGRLPAAEDILTRVVKQGAAPSRVVGGLGMVHARNGKLDLARSDFKQAADRDWRSPRFTALMAECYFDNGDFVSAQTSFQKGIELNSAHVRSIVGRARADAARGERVSEAQNTLVEVLRRPAEELTPLLKARALAGKAEVLLAGRQFEEAETAARQAVEFQEKELSSVKDPLLAHAYYDLGLALARQGKPGALDEYRKAIDRYPAVARFYYTGALSLAEAERAEDGRVLLDMASKALKQNDAFFLAKGDFLRTVGEEENAHVAYDEALKLNDVNAEAYYKKGSLYQEQGAAAGKNEMRRLFELAKQQFERAVTVRERYPEVYRAMGLIYLDLKPTSAEALEQFAKAINYYKEQKASRAVVDGFIEEVAARYVKYKLKANATAWRKEAAAMSK